MLFLFKKGLCFEKKIDLKYVYAKKRMTLFVRKENGPKSFARCERDTSRSICFSSEFDGRKECDIFCTACRQNVYFVWGWEVVLEISVV
jgi:hypothetical protein